MNSIRISKELRMVSEETNDIIRIIPSCWKGYYHVILEAGLEDDKECYHELMHINQMKKKYKSISEVAEEIDFMEQIDEKNVGSGK